MKISVEDFEAEVIPSLTPNDLIIFISENCKYFYVVS